LHERPEKLTRPLPIAKKVKVPAWLVVFAGYLSLSVATIGRDAVAAPGRICACARGVDPSAYMWALVWWPHAIFHGSNPLFTHVIWTPNGVNVAAAAMIPAAAIASWPVTALFGPLAAYNVLAILSPALASLTAYLLCRHLTRSVGPAIVGGLCFGFGSYELSQLLGHANLMLDFLVPVAVLLTVRRVENELSSRRFVAWSCVVLVAQLLLSTEILVGTLIFGGLALLLTYLALHEPIRRRLVAVAGETLLAGAIAAAVASPYIVYSAKHLPAGRRLFGNRLGLDIANLVVPTKVTWLGGGAFEHFSGRFAGGLVEAGGYLGLPLLLAFALFAFSTWRTLRMTRVLVALFALITVASLGAHLHAGGHSLVWLPWAVVKELPLLDALIPGRFTLFLDLVVAVGVALWLAHSTRAGPLGRSGVRWAIAALGVITLLPNVGSGLWNTRQENPRFFAGKIYKRYIARGESLIVIPVGALGNSMLWQAETDIYFNMPFGYISSDLPKVRREEGLLDFYRRTPRKERAQAMATLLSTHRIHHIVVLPRYEPAWGHVLSGIAGEPRRVTDVFVYTVPTRRLASSPPVSATRRPQAVTSTRPSRPT
jgi:hypothetical protein